LPHGLQTVTVPSSLDKGDSTYRYPYDLWAYLRSPNSTASNPVARSNDSYILISAGADRVFGTDDDICSFGSLK
jgi:hypothetical protein